MMKQASQGNLVSMSIGRIYKNHTGLACMVLILFLTSSNLVQAEESLYFHGFISQGYLLTTEQNYPVSNSVDGSAEFSEIGVNLYTFPREKLRLGLQLFARDLGTEGNNAVYVDWAYGDYHYRDYMGFRFGKIKLPNGLYNYTRDIDMARTQIWMPESVYPDHWRDFTLAVEGGSIYGNFDKHHFGEFDYEIFGGTLNVADPNTPYWSNVYQTSSIAAIYESNQINPDSISYKLNSTEGESVVMPWAAGIGLVWKTPVEGLRLGFTRFMGRYELNFQLNYSESLAPQDSGGITEIHEVVSDFSIQADYSIDTYSIEYTYDKLMLSYEYTIFLEKVENDHPSDGWYYQADYQLWKHFRLGAYHSTYYSDSNDREGKLLEPLSIPNHDRWQKDLCLSTRFDINDNWLIKLEGHRFNGTSFVRLNQNGIHNYEDMAKLKENWWFFLAKTTFHF